MIHAGAGGRWRAKGPTLGILARMAIKGKKKNRGSQGVRRPAEAPRPAYAPRARTPFYKTRDGMILLGILGLVALGTIVWLIGSARNEAKELEARQAQLETYNDQIEGVLQQATPVAQDMGSVQAPPADAEAADDLAADSERWIADLQQSQTQVSQIFPAPEVESINELFNEALSLYVAAAQTFALVPDAEGDLQSNIHARALAQRDTAAAVWASAIDVLDTLRSSAELSASGLRPPVSASQVPDPNASPGTEVIIPPEGAEEPAPEEDAEDGEQTGGGGGQDGDGDSGNG